MKLMKMILRDTCFKVFNNQWVCGKDRKFKTLQTLLLQSQQVCIKLEQRNDCLNFNYSQSFCFAVKSVSLHYHF